jgi:flagellum-specific ATP synthase
MGEPPSSRGYTPSVFQLLARLLEHLGSAEEGTITAVVTVLVDGDDLDEPIADAVRSIVDGHIVLDRQLAEKGHFPAIHVGQSVSRVFRDVTTTAHQQAAQRVRALLATYEEMADLIRVGAYETGSSPEIDTAIKLMPAVNHFLRQRVGEYAKLQDTESILSRLAEGWPYE